MKHSTLALLKLPFDIFIGLRLCRDAPLFRFVNFSVRVVPHDSDYTGQEWLLCGLYSQALNLSMHTEVFCLEPASKISLSAVSHRNISHFFTDGCFYFKRNVVFALTVVM